MVQYHIDCVMIAMISTSFKFQINGFFSIDLQVPNPLVLIISYLSYWCLLHLWWVLPIPFPLTLEVVAGVRPAKWYLSYYVWHPGCFKIGNISMLLWDLMLHFCVQPISLTYTRHVLAVSILHLGITALCDCCLLHIATRQYSI